MNFSTVALAFRSRDRAVLDSARALAAILVRHDVIVLVSEADVSLEGARVVPALDIGRLCDLMIAVGGDGTMLHAAGLLAAHGKPLVGVNRGRLGFLADLGPDQLDAGIEALLRGEFISEPRMLLHTRLERPGESPLEKLALNDVVLQRYDMGRMLELEVSADDQYVNTHRGDGLIVTTPTGSTAYALSSGGPIMAPGLNALALVPICPHTLSDRPVVVSGGSELKLRVADATAGQAQVVTDGQLLGAMDANDTLFVRQAGHKLNLLHPAGYNYFRILRSKLNWGRGRERN